ncbi:MAG: glutamate--tRNA ligase, partial [Nitrospinota bacterium]
MTQRLVKTRFAPSPTGTLHLGGARTALFNWLFARGANGKFVLRIEDTDRERSTEESVNEILESLEWLGLDFDEGPHFQSRRTEIYAAEVEKLLNEKKAYRCYCTKEELDAKRQAMQKAGKKPMYDRTCRDSGPNLGNEDTSSPHVIRFKTPIEGVTSFEDSLRGTVEIPNEELDDLIIRRTDGNVTYNLVVVVDDAEMGITHVIRGDDHLANTPKQVNLYKGLGYEAPKFTHVSLILGKDKKRLSKRHGAASVVDYREMGYLPEAMINMLARLGWGHGDKEVFTKQELVKLFTLDKITMSHAVFDHDKLDWLNAQHMKMLSDADLAERSLPFLHKKHPDARKDELAKLIP